jgi:hypothetical protein
MASRASKRSLWLMRGHRDTAGDIAERVTARAAGEQAIREREERYPVLTTENAREAMAFQERRIAESIHWRLEVREEQ